jgi:hypothetical protein
MRVTGTIRLVNAAPAAERRAGEFRAVGVAVSKLAAPIITRHGGGQLGRLKAAWPAVAGAYWAGLAWPVALRRDGALKLEVVPAAALELQHSAPLLIERVNLFLGTAAVTRLSLLQVLPPRASIPAPLPRPLTMPEELALDHLLCRIADPELRTSLAGLGRAVLGSRPSAPDLAPRDGAR